MAANLLWTREDDKRFALALMHFPEGSLYFLENIAQLLQKPVKEVKYYYDALLHDVALIDSDKFALPNYPEDGYVPVKEAPIYTDHSMRGKPWTQTEHGLFLIGLKKHGRGDWRSISRDCVKTRTPTQVASHAQKYFARQNLERKARKRSSIHDITVPSGLDPTWSLEFGEHKPPDKESQSSLFCMEL